MTHCVESMCSYCGVTAAADGGRCPRCGAPKRPRRALDLGTFVASPAVDAEGNATTQAYPAAIGELAHILRPMTRREIYAKIARETLETEIGPDYDSQRTCYAD